MFDSSVDMDKKIQKQQEVYKRVKLLGTGAYGKAYLVKEVKTDEMYVIKQIIMGDMSQEEQENALREAKILQALSHPNIIRFKQVYRTSKMRLNIVMEYADEGDLASKIKQAKKQSRYFEQTQILDWFTQICLGIKHIHDRKIIHRDLKAQNIFLTSDKIIKIGDFGVSRVLEKTVMNARTVVGSPYYLSPQIIENKPYSFQTDVWSLGALLYEMCALSPPFTANNLQFLALKIVKGAYGQIPNHYSYDLKSLIKSMLNTDSSKRPNINKILTSKVISKRISSFLTESKRIDQFSHTVIHNKNIFQPKFQPQNNQENALKPPPNLIHIEKDLENKSEIVLSNANFEIESSPKSRPFTPLIGQQRKGPNNFFNNAVKRPSKKVLLQEIQKNPSHHNLNDLIQIKPSALEQKVKLPKVHTNPTIFDKKQSEAVIKKNNSGLDNLQDKQIPTSAFSKKRAQSKEMFSNGAVLEAKKQISQVQKDQQKGEDLVGQVGKWKKTPKVLGKIETPPVNFSQNNLKKASITQISSTKQVANEQPATKKQEVQTKPGTTKSTHRSSSSRQAPNPVKKNLPKKQVKEKQKKTPLVISKKTSRKESQEIAPTFEVVSEEMKKKAIQQKEKLKKRSVSQSKNQAEKKKPVQKKTNGSQNGTVSNIRKPPTQAKVVKKPQQVPKPQQKLSQPPRLQFEKTNEFELTQKQGELPSQVQEETIHDLDYRSEIVEQEKCNSDRDSDQDIDEIYSCEEFEKYDENQSDIRDDDDEEMLSDSQKEERLSLNLSESCKPSNNYNKMIEEMENIKNMISMAEGVIETLPVFGDDYLEKRKLLELSEPMEEVIREDDSQMDSVINERERNEDGICENQTQNEKFMIEEPSQVHSNSSNGGSPNQTTTTNLTVFSNQEQLETLKMNLEELFGQNSIIFIHQFLCEIIEKQGLDFNQKDVQRMIMFQKPEINPVLLKKYFRLIVTVVMMQQQENLVTQ